ncbi:hypothetical protein EGX73_08245 [Enterococcus sp. FDAARGOS_553]|nr:hypothetical protein EGX73_08245 [Enterococcus sp. FDAARGOS_553]KIL81129.1 hypothetical protein EH68_10780 [Enterococcus gallinarum]TKL03965.1 hypothetical protein DVW06_15750 [Enterococcus sp. ARL09-542]OQO77581.1 hypothetical protein BH745_13550 [Enterococcus gallinarum]PCD92977.1 hypothetical protein CKY18_12225 [Enterococcus gallinarum]
MTILQQFTLMRRVASLVTVLFYRKNGDLTINKFHIFLLKIIKMDKKSCDSAANKRSIKQIGLPDRK